MTPTEDLRPHPGPDAGPAASPSAAPRRPGVGTGGRRRHAAARRSHRIRFFVDDVEQTLLASAAERAEMSVGAWVATVAVSHARAVQPTAHLSATRTNLSAAGTVAHDKARPLVMAGTTAGRTAGPMGELLRRLAEARDETSTAWHQLRAAGRLLNQVAKVGNSTGELPEDTADVLGRVSGTTGRVDAAVAELRSVAAQCRSLLTGSAPRPTETPGGTG